MSLSVLVVTVVAAACSASAPRPAPSAPSAPDRVLAGPLDGRTGGWLTLGDAASRVRVYLATLPGLLYRISTGPDSGVAPVVKRRGGRVVVRLRGTDGEGLDEVRIVLNRDVRWDIRLPAGAGEQQLHLRDGRVGRIDLGASGLAELWLPDPAGTVPVTFIGGTGTALVTAATAAPFKIRFDRGAGSVRTPWSVNNGTAAGTVLRERGFAWTPDRYLIRAKDGLGRLILHRPVQRRPEPAARPGDLPKPAARPGGPKGPAARHGGPAARPGGPTGPAVRPGGPNGRAARSGHPNRLGVRPGDRNGARRASRPPARPGGAIRRPA
ncbi:hypothetical protein [Actinoplanes aureus]|uniref:AMIN domain-containing protein n=1 Tax=Actinoplanes aureus TaxID=2792083 RepID=A0A931G7H6_9ACTN|nr:hypothetical protein [Actinoplanes aureus]MBG0568259.1 hypothetical protein [Actinoplanes aureus]